jgi:hypothetical protein
MSHPVRTSSAAASSLLCALASIACGILVILTQFDFLLFGIAGFGVLAIGLGIRGIRQVRRNPGQLTGAALAKWGIGLPLAGLVLGFVLLPAT